MFDHKSCDELSTSSRPFSSSNILDTGSALQHALGTLADPSPGPYSTASGTIQGISLKPSSAMKCSLAVGSGFGSLPAQINSTMAMPRRALFEKELTGRQNSSPAGIDDENYLDQLLPPKRELPFAKPASKPPSRDALPIPQSTLSMDVLSLPCPVRIKKPVKAQAAAPEAKAKNITSAAVEPSCSSTELPDNPISDHKSSIAPTPSMYNTASMPQSSPSLAYGMGNGPPTSIVPARGDPDDRGRPQGPAEQPRAIADNVSDEYFTRIDAFVQKYRNRPVAEAYVENAGADLAAFAALPEAERLAAIDAEIVDCIGDDSFLQLCEDVEKSWKRIALGF
ncbi:MAG: hypothetical protein LQ347_005816 [Umbilicaria vellea]|nr:MAG: hypothetical protein LQ347_005816 [Umbilicaria vellea]